MPRKNFDLMEWLAAWTEGVKACWPEPDVPKDIADLQKVRDSAPYTPPELAGERFMEAWWIYLKRREYDPIGRAAVALAYIISANTHWNA